SFVLEVLWWAMTGTWAELPAWPRPDDPAVPEIAIEIDRAIGETVLGHTQGRDDVETREHTLRLRSRFDFAKQQWANFPLHFSRGPLPALVVYARADGSFAVWDPARNHYTLRPPQRFGVSDVETAADPSLLRRPPAYLFDAKDLWNGLVSHGKTLCNGL